MTGPLRIELVASPMSAHLHPLLGLGRRLAREFEVRVISTAGAQAEIEAASLSGPALLRGADAEIAARVNPRHRVSANPWRLHEKLRDSLALLERFQQALVARWQTSPPDPVIADSLLPVAGSAARQRGIRWWTVTASPCALETPDGPPGFRLSELAPSVTRALAEPALSAACRRMQTRIAATHAEERVAMAL